MKRLYRIGLLQFARKIGFYALVGRMGEIVLLLAVWDIRIGRTRWDGGGVEGKALAGAGLGAPALDIEVWQTAGSGGYHHFHWCCRGGGLFVSVQKNNHNIRQTNPNCNIVQDGTKRTYNTILI